MIKILISKLQESSSDREGFPVVHMKQDNPLVFKQLFIQAALAAAVEERCVVAEVGPTAPS